MSRRPSTILVTGDVTIDWNIARVRRRDGADPTWNAEDYTRACLQPGGAALVADLIQAVATTLQDGQPTRPVIHPVAAPPAVKPGDPAFAHSYAMWSLFEPTDHPAWRVTEYLGFDHQESPATSVSAWPRLPDDPGDADMIVIDDANLGFRDRAERWPQSLDHVASRPWILLKVSHRVAQGDLWERLRERHAERLVVVVPVNDLRLMDVQVSRELSWESTAQDLFWELTHNPSVNALAQCAHVVVSLHTAGAFVLSRTRSGHEAVLFFDPVATEGEWAQEHPGGMIGYTSCLLAGLAREFMQDLDRPDVHRGIQSGLAGLRALHLAGYHAEKTGPGQVRLTFPSGRIADELAQPSMTFATAKVRDPARAPTRDSPDAYWTILEDRYPNDLRQHAQRVVVEGVETELPGVPIGRFGKLVTVDRREIEALRSVRGLIAEYCSQPQGHRLSIAVFGPPGSGKSFAVEQVADSTRRGQITSIRFNLSQFHEPDDLLGAFHQVRDVALSGKMPLVFWDEFDAALDGLPLGWLRYFLAPMQDGSFLQGETTHPIGHAIFVFAGGTSSRMEAFGEPMSPEAQRAAKVPDFMSRLTGYINVLGPNRQPVDDGHDSTADAYSVIRRAVLLRALLQKRAPHLFEKGDGHGTLSIDRGVLRAFMEIDEYKHGVRSLESLVAMSRLAGRRTFERSCLPPQAQLDLHVNGLEFLALVRQPEPEGDPLEQAKGWREG